jgi:hypothetical protein
VAVAAGKSKDNCPRYAERLIEAWELPWSAFDPATGDAAGALRALADAPGAAAVLWAE